MKITSTTFNKPQLDIIVKEGEKHLWSKFAEHHYMNGSLPSSSVFYTFYWIKNEKEILIGCCGILFQIAKNIKARRFTRIVVLPEYQGLGFGSKIINSIGKFYKDNNIDKMFLSTFHPRLGEFMGASKYWTPSANNLKEFNKNELDKSSTIKNLRDGVSMYRYNFIGWAEYELLYNPILIRKLKNELADIKKEQGLESAAYKTKLAEYNATPKSIPIPDTPIIELTKEFEGHIKSKAEHKKLFMKNKRKALSAAERKEMKAKKKEEIKNAKNKTS